MALASRKTLALREAEKKKPQPLIILDTSTVIDRAKERMKIEEGERDFIGYLDYCGRGFGAALRAAATMLLISLPALKEMLSPDSRRRIVEFGRRLDVAYNPFSRRSCSQ
ncbi:MAG: hypothetical protein QW186_10000 [Candidatus Bathyarchaeia archaeon]